MKSNVNNSLPALYLDKLESPRRVGRQLQCVCPLCHTRHLFVNPESGLFKCFYAGCAYKGIAEEKKEALRERSRAHHRKPVSSYPKARVQRKQLPGSKQWTADGCDHLTGCEEDESEWYD